MSLISTLDKNAPLYAPAIQESNRRLTRAILWLGGFGIVLAFVLPETDVLSNTAPFKFLERLVPSATKAAGVALYPNVVRVYFSLMFTLVPLLAVYFLLRYEPWGDRRNTMSGHWALEVGRIAIAVPILLAFLSLFYILPGTVSATSSGSRGQLFIGLIVMTKPGLAAFGGFISAGIFIFWWMVFLSVGVFVLNLFHYFLSGDKSK